MPTVFAPSALGSLAGELLTCFSPEPQTWASPDLCLCSAGGSQIPIICAGRGPGSDLQAVAPDPHPAPLAAGREGTPLGESQLSAGSTSGLQFCTLELAVDGLMRRPWIQLGAGIAASNFLCSPQSSLEDKGTVNCVSFAPWGLIF